MTPGRRARVLLAAGIALAALAGCGGGAHQQAPTPAASNKPAQASNSRSAAATRALSPASLVGKTLFGLDDSNAVCRAVLDGTPMPGLPGDGGPGTSSGSDAGTAMANATGTLVPGGLLVLPCAPDPSSPSSILVAFDLFRRDIAWRWSLAGYDSFTFGTSHVFLISHVTTPATGLQSAKTAYTLTAVSLATGGKSWSAPYQAASPDDGDTQVTGLTEGPSGIAAHPQSVVLTYLGTSAYDAQTGASLWHIPTEFDTLANGSYGTTGVIEVYGYQDNYYDSHITGFDAPNGRQRWDLRLPVACSGGEEPEDDVFAGVTEWEFSDSCEEAHDVATGKLVDDRAYPSSWQSVAATPTAVLAYDGTHLSYFVRPDLRRPAWSKPAGTTTALAVSAGHVLVDAPSGLLVLSTADGSITATVSAAFTGSGHYTVVDGLVAQGEIDGTTSVLELDPPAATR